MNECIKAIIDYANKVVEENKNYPSLAAQAYEHEEQKRKDVEMAALNARANFGKEGN